MSEQNQENQNAQAGDQANQPPVQPTQPVQPPVQPQAPVETQPVAQPQVQPQPTVQTQAPVQPQVKSLDQQTYQSQKPFGQPNAIFPSEIPQDYLLMNILATIIGMATCWFCCIGGFVGIVGIVFSTQVKSKVLAGNLPGAKSDSNTAKILGFVSLGLTVLAFIYFVVNLITIIAGGSLQTVIEQYQEQFESLGY